MQMIHGSTHHFTLMIILLWKITGCLEHFRTKQNRHRYLLLVQKVRDRRFVHMNQLCLWQTSNKSETMASLCSELSFDNQGYQNCFVPLKKLSSLTESVKSVHTFISSKLGYCNVQFAELTKSSVICLKVCFSAYIGTYFWFKHVEEWNTFFCDIFRTSNLQREKTHTYIVVKINYKKREFHKLSQTARTDWKALSPSTAG